MPRVEEIRLCNFGFEEYETKIVEISVLPGEDVSVDQSMIVCESDKSSLEVPAPYSGTIKDVLVSLGDMVNAKTILLTLRPDPLSFRNYLRKISKNSITRSNKNSRIYVIEILNEGLRKFREDFPPGRKTAFMIMSFRESKVNKEVFEIVRRTFEKLGIMTLRADDKEYSDELYSNVKVYMDGCTFGVALFERIESNEFNPNVSLEVGYMMGKGKKILLLKDDGLSSLPADLVGQLYKSFDASDIPGSLSSQLKKWVQDKNLV